jgi:hypothetical protein
MELPRTPLLGFLLLLLWRLILRVRGLDFRERDETQVAPKDLARIDVVSSAAFGLGLADTIRAAALQSRHLLLALAAGEPRRIARALAFETINVSTGGSLSWRRTEWVMERGRQLAERSGRPETIALSLFARGFAFYIAGKFRRGFQLLEESHRTFRNECTGCAYEMGTAQWVTLNCLSYMGELKELCARRPVYMREAVDRGDLYGVVSLHVNVGNIACLVADDADHARVEIDDALRRWSKQGFHVEHLSALVSRTSVDLYAGRPEAAYANLVEAWPMLRWSLLMTVQIIRLAAHASRGASSLALAEAGARDQQGLLAVAERDARRLEQENLEWGTSHAALLRAGIAVVRDGNLGRARRMLERALEGFERAEMGLYASAVRACLGSLLGGAEGRSLVDASDAWMAAQTVQNPGRMVAMLAPGFSKVSARG